MPQEEIHRLLLEHARAGPDASCGSRAATRSCSAAAARRRSSACEAGIPFEVVPGVTAGVAAPAYAGIPVTHRELASGVAFVTGHEDPAKPETALDWPALAAFPGTLVFYMGVRALPRIAEQLIAGGRAGGRAGRGRRARHAARPADASLATLADVAERAAAEAHPGARDHARRAGRRAARAARLARAAAAARAHRRRHARAAAGERARRAAARARRRRWSRRRRSARARSTAELPRPRRLRPGLRDVARTARTSCSSGSTPPGCDARALAGRTVAAIGPGTARALREHGIARRRRARARRRRGPRRGARGRRRCARALIVRGREGRDVLPDALRARGADGRPARALRDGRRAARRGDRARRPPRRTTSRSRRPRPCASSSPPAGALDGPRIASIGPATSAALREAGLEPDLEADPHTPDGLVAALVADAACPPRG